MKQDLNHLPYYDGRNLDQLTARIAENQKNCQSVVVKPEIPEGKPVQLRYPHPLEEKYTKVSVQN